MRMRTNEILMANNIDIAVVREQNERMAHYVLLKIGFLGRNTYAICVFGDGYALESVGEDEALANTLYETVLRNGLAPEHVFDVVTDFRRNAFLE